MRSWVTDRHSVNQAWTLALMETFAALAVLLVLAVLVGIPIMLVLTWLKVRRIDDLARRIEQLEQRLGPSPGGKLPPAAEQPATAVHQPPVTVPPLSAATAT